MKYRKKPIVVEAVKVRDLIKAATTKWRDLPEWVVKAYEKGDMLFTSNKILIQTLEGEMRADIDDMLIRGIEGEIYPCKPDIFKLTYEAVTDEG